MIKPKLTIEKSTASSGLGITTSWTTYNQALIKYNEAYLTYSGGVGEQFSNRTDIPLKLELVDNSRPQMNLVDNSIPQLQVII